jgi:hypothetical protein
MFALMLPPGVAIENFTARIVTFFYCKLWVFLKKAQSFFESLNESY